MPGSVETHMNESSRPNHENRIVTRVPRIRASLEVRRGKVVYCIFSHLNRLGGAPSGAAAFIAMVKDEPALIISDFFDFLGKSRREAVVLGGSFLHRASAPAAWASHNSAIITRRLMKNPDQRGGKGMLPACCPPPGERGGHPPGSCRE
jgi:hypothetical protein